MFTDPFGIPVEHGWTGFPDALPILLAAALDETTDPDCGPLLFFDSDGSLVGNGGWKGRPIDGVGELGFRVVDDLRPGLKAIREHERELGDDDFGPRVAMRKSTFGQRVIRCLDFRAKCCG